MLVTTRNLRFKKTAVDTWLSYLVAAIEFVDHGHLGRFLARLLDGIPLCAVAGGPQPGLCERRHDDGMSSSKSEERKRKRGAREKRGGYLAELQRRQ